MTPSISLTMIVRDEEADLAACLASARELADELVVVDTGSTDRTREIARAHGATVHDFVWVDDFAAARNFALDRATGDWVLVLDADERLHAEAPASVRAWLASLPRETCFARVPVVDRLPGGGSSVYHGRRIFRRLPAIRWQHPVHERLVHAEGDGPARDAVAPGLRIEHAGRVSLAGERARQKIARNVRILEREIAARPGDADLLRLLARELLALDDPGRALATARRGLALATERDLREALWAVALRAALAAGQPAVAQEALADVGESVASGEFAYLLGCALEGTGDLDQAERMLEQARARHGAPTPFAIDADATGWKALQELGAVAWTRGDHAAALARWREALAEAPEQVPLNMLVGQALVATGQYQEAYEHLDRLTRAHPEVAAYWEALGRLLIDDEEWPGAADALGRAVERHELPSLYAMLSIALEKLGRAEDARNARLIAERLSRRRG